MEIEKKLEIIKLAFLKYQHILNLITQFRKLIRMFGVMFNYKLMHNLPSYLICKSPIKKFYKWKGLSPVTLI